MFSVHGWETVAPLWLFSLISKLDKILDLFFHLCHKFQVLSGIVFEAVTVNGGGADVEGVSRCVYLQSVRQTPVSLQSRTLLVTFKPSLLRLLLSEQRADVHGVAELHVRQFAGHGDGSVPLI